MTARLDSVAKYICERGNWRVSNLKLQKLMYLAQMVHMGRNSGAPLFAGSFEAWDYGPVEPVLYRKVRAFGAGPVGDVFVEAGRFRDDDPRKALLDETCNDLIDRSPGELVEITHWKDGAWARHYESGYLGKQIPDSDIAQEYLDRLNA